MDQFLFKPLDKAFDFVLDLSIRHLGYIIFYKGYCNELDECVKELENKKVGVEGEVKDAENNGRIIKADVKDWINKVNEEWINERNKFENVEAHTKTGCSEGVLPYLWHRHQLGRNAKKMTDGVKSLIDKPSKFNGVSYQQNPKSLGVYHAVYEEFASRKKTTEDIMAKLEDSSVRMIGVHGPAGVGKTILVNAIANKARDEKKLFNKVVRVDITENPDPQKIQEEIGYVLGLKFEGEGETVRADRLRRSLKEEKENTLIILDDLWDKLDLNKLGIPFDDDDLNQVTDRDKKDFGSKMAEKEKPAGVLSQETVKGEKNFGHRMMTEEESHGDSSQKPVKGEKDFGSKVMNKEKTSGDYKGCKILLTSRDKKVLSDKMDVEERSIILVDKLDDDDSMTLFKKVAGITDIKSKFKPKILNYCGGLPMAIVTIGSALRKKNPTEREDAVEKLKKQEWMGVQKSMEFSVKMSYDHLESKELKSIFLLCARMGHQPLIMDLVKYCIGLCTLEGVYTLKEARDRISDSIEKLIDSALMLEGNSSDCFNMHNMVRDAALSIAHEEQNVFTLRNGKLDDWPDKDELQRFTAISIHNSDIIDGLPKVLNCPQLKVLHIDNDDPSLKIPHKFFEGMEKLRVLILTGFDLSCLPSSIKCLSNLRMLCLERCVLSDKLSLIGVLKKLRILSFSGSEIKKLPAELGNLCKLQLLDISDCSIANAIPPNVISSMTSLEELYVRRSLIKFEDEGKTNQSIIAFLSELRHLHQLTILDICIPSVAVLPGNLFFDKLNDYKIVIGDFKNLSIGGFKMPGKYEASRSLALQLKDGTDIHFQKGLKLLFKRVENLLLGELYGVQNAFYELNLDGFPYLKHLSIINNLDIEYIINAMELSHTQEAFPKLESLWLYKLRNMKKICCSKVMGASFSKLKIIKFKICSQLKNLFSSYMVEFLESLETIDVSECDSLEEIVINEGEVNGDRIKFPKLRSLTLQWLPLFASFYANGKIQATNKDHGEITIADDGCSVAASLPLFNEWVEIPNLESLKLSSINIHNIWSDQLISNSCFQNLIKLTLKDCNNLIYLCSFSVAKGLKKLKGLFVSECQMMEKLFDTKGNSVDYSKDCIFPKLEEIQLSSMNMLKDIWQAKVNADSFSGLISVHIEGCKKLDKIFPIHMAERFGSLDSLKVVDCGSVEVIFELKDSQQIDVSRIDTKLRVILLDGLPNLKQVWNGDPRGFNFKNLRSIRVSNCDKLSNVLPASVTKGLEELEEFSLQSCDGIEEIVAGEKVSETSNNQLEFPKVTCMEFCGLRNIKRFCNGNTVDCPKLKQLSVFDCDYLETFTTETTNGGQPVFSAKKVISNLESIEIDLKEAKWLQRNINKYRMHRLKELCLHNLPSIDILYWFLHRAPNLERLKLDSADIQRFVPSGNHVQQQRLGAVLHLKELTLWWLWDMKNIGFERDPVLQRVERLHLLACDGLINLAPPSVSFTDLTYLEVDWCDDLIHLMASSTARTLAQLTTMKIIRCAKIKEIVSNEGNEARVVEFRKLKTLELVKLKSFTSFCSYMNCEFNFPSLEKLIVRDCPRMKTFTESTHTRAPKLQNILAIEGEEEQKWYWEGDLNTTIQKVFTDKLSFQYTDRLVLSNYPEIKQVWYGNDLVQENSFNNLKSLVISNCEYLVHVIPSHLLPCFHKLEELRVMDCSVVKVIFNIEDIRVTKALGKYQLKKLSLEDLPTLEHVWDKDPEGIVGFQGLQDMHIDGCKRLLSVFPALVAKDLARLTRLYVANCKELVEIFAKDETASEGATKEFVFPCVSSLTLRKLPKLRYFCPGLQTLKWPALEQLDVCDCDLVTLKCQEAHPEGQVLIPIEKVIQISSLEKLSFGMGVSMVNWYPRSQRLKFQNLQCFPQHSDGVLYEFLQMVPSPNIKKLEVIWSSLKKIFSAERPNADYIGVLLSHLEELKLSYLNKLNSIGLEHSWLQHIPENLQTLEVERCDGLINLVPIMVSFSNLMHLTVYGCDGMLYLFTSSTAKNLGRLKQMSIRRCKLMQEIVSKEEDESHHDDEKIIFEKLEALYLEDLPKLGCFYSGNYIVCFPSLEELRIINCHRMKTLCLGNVRCNLTKSKLSFGYGDVTTCNDDLNATMQKMHEEKDFLKYIEQLELSDYPELKQIWYGKDLVQVNGFRNLESLVISNCEYLVHVIPSHLLPCFHNLEKLRVSDCSAVKVIFNIEDVRVAKALGKYQLKNFSLKDLPTLEYVWDKDPKGIVGFQGLQDMHVDGCDSLKSLFPTSVAKDLARLESLYVTNCKELVEIVTKDETAVEEATKEFLFPCLISLKLRKLPGLKYFYPGLHTLEWPDLNVLEICNLVIFKGQEAHPKERIPFPIEKVVQTPSFETLSFSMGDTQVNWYTQSRGLKFENLQCFPEDSGSVLYEFLQMVSSPNIKMLEVRYSSLEEMFSAERPNTDYIGVLISRLEELKLSSLNKLNSIGLEHSWLQHVPENLQTLEVERCDGLINLVPIMVSFSNLTHLTVSGCDGMLYLFTCSTAKSLGRLKQMSIRRCKLMQEIVSKEEDESHHDDEKIIFEKLEALFLEDLPKLGCFYSGNYTVCFPSLDELHIINCHRMKTLCLGNVRCNLTKSKLSFGYGDVTTCNDDLNATMQKMHEEKVFLKYIERLELSDYPELKQVWYRNDLVQENGFRNLESLVISNCEYLVHVVPSHLLPCFHNLEELRVSDCSAVKVIFNIEDMSVTKALGKYQLKKLSLKDLPTLEYVWDKDPKGIVGFQGLQDMRVDGCDSLKSLFPASVAKDLTRLESLYVTNCKELVEIVAKDEVPTEGETKNFLFHCLTSLTLKALPELKYFYPGLHTLEWPVLNVLEICNLVTFKGQEAHPKERIPFPIEKLVQIPNFETLSFSMGDTQVNWYPQSQGLQFEKLQCFPEDSDSVLYEFLQMVPSPNIKTLGVRWSSLEKMFSAERPNADYIGVLLSHLEELKLSCLDKLNSIGLEHSWLHPIPENLQTLEVDRCDGLINLVPIMVSFSNLTHLTVYGCDGMLYLFTSSTAKSLGQLKRMEIRSCKSMQEILSEEGDESDQNEKIIFWQLEALHLECLPELKCFYSGNYTLCFPSLQKLCIIECQWMQTFCPVSEIDPSKLKLFKEDGDETVCEGDLNTTMRKMYEEKVTPNLESLSLSEKVLKMVWRGQFQENLFHKLKVLVLVGFDIKPDVFPYGFLHKVPNIEKLVVKSSSFEEIFCSQRPDVDYTGLLSQLKELELNSLSELISIGLEHSWVEPFLKSLETLKVERCCRLSNLVPSPVCFTNLMHLTATGCHELIYLLTSSAAKSLAQLEQMFIKECQSIEKIVFEEVEESNHGQGEIIFEQLNTLCLDSLPSLSSFYSGSSSLSFPCLEQLSVINCPKMETFCAGTINANKLSGVIFQHSTGAVPLEVDLNCTIRKAFHQATGTSLNEVSDESNKESNKGSGGTRDLFDGANTDESEGASDKYDEGSGGTK